MGLRPTQACAHSIQNFSVRRRFARRGVPLVGMYQWWRRAGRFVSFRQGSGAAVAGVPQSPTGVEDRHQWVWTGVPAQRCHRRQRTWGSRRRSEQGFASPRQGSGHSMSSELLVLEYTAMYTLTLVDKCRDTEVGLELSLFPHCSHGGPPCYKHRTITYVNPRGNIYCHHQRNLPK